MLDRVYIIIIVEYINSKDQWVYIAKACDVYTLGKLNHPSLSLSYTTFWPTCVSLSKMDESTILPLPICHFIKNESSISPLALNFHTSLRI